MKLLVAIPAFNEELSISDVISDVKKHIPSASILVIDDGSIDKTANCARLAGAIVISLPFNVGVGGAMRVAYKFALRNGFDHVLQIDADGQHLASEARHLLDESSDDALIIGSRFKSNSKKYKAGYARRISMMILAKMLSVICKTELTDVTSGFRLSSGKTIEIFSNEYPRDYLGDTVESLVIVRQNGLLIKEVPVEMNLRQHGSPSQNLVKSIWYLIRVIIVIFLATFRKRSK